MRSAAAILLVCATAGVASAGPPGGVGGGLSIDVGAMGDAVVFGTGGRAALVVPEGPIALVFEGAIERARSDAADRARGVLGRIGAGIRATPASEEAPDVALDMVVEAGGGVEAVRWRGGGWTRRPEGWLGVGLQMRNRGRHVFTVGLVLRVVVADPYAGGEVARAACRGACATPVVGAPVDVGSLVLVEGTWDR